MTGIQPASAGPQVPSTPRPDLSDRQKQLILAAANELIGATVLSRQPAFSDPTLAGAANHLVSGAFVSLKRRGRLRSCCGVIGQPIPLAMALQDAAIRTAWEDLRFPPVSPTELDHLDLEVWLLYSPEPVEARGEERIRAVTVGKHGLQIMQGQARGLLLPGVPVENKWDAEEFLEQVCIKAGLPTTAWKDDETILFTFGGEAIRGRTTRPETIAEPVRPPARFKPEDLVAYAQFCQFNIIALLTRATPSFYFTGAPDGNVNGVVLSVRRAQAENSLDVGQISLRPGVPLQATLFSMTQGAAQALADGGIKAEELQTLQAGITVLYDPAMHGSVAEPHLDGIDPQHRAVMVIERSKVGIVFDPLRSAEELLKEGAVQATVRNRAGSAVFSLEALSTLPRVTFTTVPRAVRGPAARPPGVAGTFYPADPGELSRMLDDFLAGEAKQEAWPAAMVPHAGLIYSGRIAAGVFKRLKIPRTVIILCPRHTPLGTEWAVAPQRTWSIPGAEIESDFMLARQLSQAIPGLEMDALAHQREHAIEVELPFIARLAPQAKVIGIAIGGGDLATCRKFAEGLAGVVKKLPERPLLLVSSDMHHFATDAENRRRDELALAALETLDPEEVYATVLENGISMCGVLPAVIVLETLRLLGGVKKAERTGYATTADVTGDKSRVVGYAGMVWG